jgi:hypothetical protein
LVSGDWHRSFAVNVRVQAEADSGSYQLPVTSHRLLLRFLH